MSGDDALPNSGDVIVGKYRIEKLIGKGGMGAVFSAQHELLGQRVAIKFLLGDILNNQEAVQRFLNEARNAAKLQSEHVARVMDVGKSETNLPYMVMEFLDGGDLSQLIEQRGAVPVEDAVDYVLQALEAIAQAHALGIVHRDLKPANLYLAKRQDGSYIVKVLDFGIAKSSNPFGEGGNHGLTSTKSMLGSPLYMSPEQLRSAKNVDQRADIWALGVILYELLTGTVPFNGETLGELFIAILETVPIPVSQRRPDVPQVLSDAIQRCLSRQLDGRFNNVAELAQALAPCAPARSYVSVERITTALGGAPGSVVMPNRAASQSYGGGSLPARTAALGIPAGTPMPGTIPTGTPQPGQLHGPVGASSTNAGWGQQTGGMMPPPTKSPLPLIAGIGGAALVLLLVASIGIYKVTRKDPTAAGTGTATTTATPTATVDTKPTATATDTKPVDTGTKPIDTGTVAQVKPVDTKTGAATTHGTGTRPPPTATTASTAATVQTTAPTATTKPTATATSTKPFDPFGGR